MKNKELSIINELREIAKQLKYGELCITFKIHEGEIVAGEIKNQIKKLG